MIYQTDLHASYLLRIEYDKFNAIFGLTAHSSFKVNLLVENSAQNHVAEQHDECSNCKPNPSKPNNEN